MKRMFIYSVCLIMAELMTIACTDDTEKVEEFFKSKAASYNSISAPEVSKLYCDAVEFGEVEEWKKGIVDQLLISSDRSKVESGESDMTLSLNDGNRIVSNLEPGTTYYYRLKFKPTQMDMDGNREVKYSAVKSFKTEEFSVNLDVDVLGKHSAIFMLSLSNGSRFISKARTVEIGISCTTNPDLSISYSKIDITDSKKTYVYTTHELDSDQEYQLIPYCNRDGSYLYGDELTLITKDSVYNTAVDLGLSVKWAEHALLYHNGTAPRFTYGSLKPDNTAKTSVKEDLNAEHSYYVNSGNNYRLDFKYVGRYRTYAHDAAYYHYGDRWRLPTKDEVEELLNSCVFTRVNKTNAEWSSPSTHNQILFTLQGNSYWTGSYYQNEEAYYFSPFKGPIVIYYTRTTDSKESLNNSHGDISEMMYIWPVYDEKMEVSNPPSGAFPSDSFQTDVYIPWDNEE